jgi:hypothetical protein
MIWPVWLATTIPTAASSKITIVRENIGRRPI